MMPLGSRYRRRFSSVARLTDLKDYRALGDVGGGGLGGVGTQVEMTDDLVLASGGSNGANNIPWGVEVWDTAGYWDSGNPERLTADVNGLYLAFAHVTFVFLTVIPSPIIAQLSFRVNNSEDFTLPFVHTGAHPSGNSYSMSMARLLTAGDYVSTYVWANSASGGSCRISSAISGFSLVRVG